MSLSDHAFRALPGYAVRFAAFPGKLRMIASECATPLRGTILLRPWDMS